MQRILYVFFYCYLIISAYLYYIEACTHASEIDLTIKRENNRIEVKNTIYTYIERLTIMYNYYEWLL